MKQNAVPEIFKKNLEQCNIDAAESFVFCIGAKKKFSAGVGGPLDYVLIALLTLIDAFLESTGYDEELKKEIIMRVISMKERKEKANGNSAKR